MTRAQWVAAHNRWLDPPEDPPDDDEDEEGCEWCGSRRKCRCQQLIDDFEWER
jgi:hypothetical protein